MKKLAPNGEYLANVLRRGSPYEIAIIFIGAHSKERADDLIGYSPIVLYLPSKASPSEYIWPVNGCDIYLWDTEQSSFSFIKFCVVTFFAYGAREVQYSSDSKSYIFNQQKGI